MLYRLPTARGARPREDCKPERTFAALFNGARQRGWYATHGPNPHPIFGKAEAEWGWPHDFETLRDAGLITFTISESDAPGLIGGKSTDIEWQITNKGWEVRKDDLAYFRALMDAMAADEASQNTSQNAPVADQSENG